MDDTEHPPGSGPDLLRAELARRALSVSAAAEVCGLDRFTLMRLLSTEAPPRRVTVDHAVALAAAFGVPVEAWTTDRLPEPLPPPVCPSPTEVA